MAYEIEFVRQNTYKRAQHMGYEQKKVTELTSNDVNQLLQRIKSTNGLITWIEPNPSKKTALLESTKQGKELLPPTYTARPAFTWAYETSKSDKYSSYLSTLMSE